MKENDIEYDVPFTVERTGYLGERELMNVKISKSDDYTGFELSYADSTKQMGNSYAVMQELMFSDKMRIIQKLWKPKNNEMFWYVCMNGEFNARTFSNLSVIHLAMYISGNCFKTRADAEKHKNDVLKILKGEPLVKWED